MPFAARWRVAMPLLVLALWMSTLTPGAFAAPPLAGESRELIVLLSRGAAPPEEVVERIRQNRPLPDDLGVGNPVGARLLIPKRDRPADGETGLDEIQETLLRFVVLEYPSVVNLDAIQRALERNPRVLAVSVNPRATLSASPNDPLFPQVGTPDQYQWGSHSLHLPEAWDYNKGHAYIAVIDGGIEIAHPDLGANFRSHLAFDYGYPDETSNSVDEGQSQYYGSSLRAPDLAGHGTHVAGIVAATPNNSTGVAGACWNCSLIINKVSTLGFIHSGPLANKYTNAQILSDRAVAGVNGAIDKGAQVVTMSFGFRSGDGLNYTIPTCQGSSYDAFCLALERAAQRDMVIVAATGNDNSATIDFPASAPWAIPVGGIASSGAFWNDCGSTTGECGSNYDPGQIVAPAKQILSSFYRGKYWSAQGSGCEGYTDFGLCTGTSMAAPYLAGSIGVLRSVNPLLTRANIEHLLENNLENPIGWDSQKGVGKPHLGNAVKAALGMVDGQVLPNRLTPLFSLYHDLQQDYLYTTVPQMAVAAIAAPGYSTEGPLTPDYFAFPGVLGSIPCLGLSCTPRASVYIFTGDKAPYTGAPALVPLYRMTKIVSSSDRDTTYAISSSEITTFQGQSYNLDGIEGYIYQRCSPEPQCLPAGAVRLYRLNNTSETDWAIFPESELTTMQAAGYTTALNSQSVIGYAYLNIDTDGDAVVDGFETLMGTSASSNDSDCDGTIDGVEILEYPYTDPKLPYFCGKRAQVLSQTLPSTMVAGQTYSVSVTLKNSGSVAWNPVGVQCNAYRWASLNNHWTTVRAELPNTVAPGQQVTVTFNVQAPSTPGTYDFAWQMVHECVEWFGDAAPVIAVTVRAAQTKDAQVLSQTVPSTMTAGQSYAVSLKLKNVGTQSWNLVGAQCNAYRLGSLHTHWSPTRAELASTVTSGQEVTLSFNVTAPATPGTYAFQWQMVQECVQWFGDQSPLVNVTVN